MMSDGFTLANDCENNFYFDDGFDRTTFESIVDYNACLHRFPSSKCRKILQ